MALANSGAAARQFRVTFSNASSAASGSSEPMIGLRRLAKRSMPSRLVRSTINFTRPAACCSRPRRWCIGERLSPVDSLARFELADGLAIETVLHEHVGDAADTS
ncbi:MAG: hypothetical protein Ct9H300mP7_2990 [Verrucomicrobiota bacterium]|nr:MAG: hypothetical protein Ct9H300mP7_2990 [Verrucomicrobiota bacterium]